MNAQVAISVDVIPSSPKIFSCAVLYEVFGWKRCKEGASFIMIAVVIEAGPDNSGIAKGKKDTSSLSAIPSPLPAYALLTLPHASSSLKL
jgi:hypothetical protein